MAKNKPEEFLLESKPLDPLRSSSTVTIGNGWIGFRQADNVPGRKNKRNHIVALSAEEFKEIVHLARGRILGRLTMEELVLSQNIDQMQETLREVMALSGDSLRTAAADRAIMLTMLKNAVELQDEEQDQFLRGLQIMITIALLAVKDSTPCLEHPPNPSDDTGDT